MKKKRLTYLLIVCVAGVWGVIFYRLYVSVNSEGEKFIVPIVVPKAQSFSLLNHESDNIEFNFNYLDPFSEITMPKESTNKQSWIEADNGSVQANIPKPQVDWSAIRYTGFILNHTAKEKVAIIQIAGTEIMLTEGKKMHGVKLLKHAGDSIKVQYQNDTKYISIQ